MVLAIEGKSGRVFETVAEAAARHGLSYHRMWQVIDDSKLVRYRRHANRKEVFYRVDAVDELFDIRPVIDDDL